MVPRSILRTPPRTFMSVDLPAPFSPTTPRISPRPSSSEMRVRTCTPAKDLSISCIRSMGSSCTIGLPCMVGWAGSTASGPGRPQDLVEEGGDQDQGALEEHGDVPLDPE